MIELRVLGQKDKDTYIEFLVEHFGDEIPEDAIRKSATLEIDCMFSDYFRKPTFYSFHQNGEMIGTSGIIREWSAPNTWSIFWVCVHKDHRGKGFGRHIMESTTEDFAQNKLDGAPGTLMLCALEHNCPFYETLGFEKGAQGHKWFFMTKAVNV